MLKTQQDKNVLQISYVFQIVEYAFIDYQTNIALYIITL